MDEEIFNLAIDNNLTFDEAQEVQDIADEMGLDTEDAIEIWQSL